jgi:hypothetical protein
LGETTCQQFRLRGATISARLGEEQTTKGDRLFHNGG